jgi:hypothetical protein
MLVVPMVPVLVALQSMMLLVLMALQSMMLLVLMTLSNFFLHFLGLGNFLFHFLVLGDFSRMCWSTDLLFNYDVAHYGTCE